MNEYNNQFGLRDIFMNPALASVFPQFGKSERLQNVYSFADTEERVQRYLVAALNGVATGKGEITVRGKQQTVLNRVRQLQPLIEGLINNMPKVAKALRANTRLYLPYATKKQMEDIKTPAAKQRALKLVLDNFQYNPDFGALNSIKNEPPAQFERNRKAWDTRVGRRLKKV